MQILPTINTISNYKVKQPQQLSYGITGENLKPLPCDTVSFGRCPGDKELRALLAYGIPDIYTGKIMIPQEELQGLMQKRVFLFPLKKLTKILNKYSDCLQNVPFEIFSIIKKQAKQHPTATLDNVIHSLVPEHNALLLKKQNPIFDELSVIAQEMPPEQLKEFNELMRVTKAQINNEEIHKSFDAREFRYKLQKIIERNQSRNIASEIKVMRKLNKLAYRFPRAEEEGSFKEKVKKSEKKKGVDRKKSADKVFRKKQALVIRQMKKLLDNSPLASDKEFRQLMYTARMQIHNLQVYCPFQRKAFIMDLKNITDKLEDRNLANRLIQCATTLPNSSENVSAFIVKAAESSAEKIGHDLLIPSVGTIEHLKPSKSGGKDNINNYALASAGANSSRAHMSFANWLRKHPETYKNCQKYVDRLIELYNFGVFKKVRLHRDYIINFANLVKNMSPPEKPLVLDLSKLKER